MCLKMLKCLSYRKRSSWCMLHLPKTSALWGSVYTVMTSGCFTDCPSKGFIQLSSKSRCTQPPTPGVHSFPWIFELFLYIRAHLLVMVIHVCLSLVLAYLESMLAKICMLELSMQVLVIQAGGLKFNPEPFY